MARLNEKFKSFLILAVLRQSVSRVCGAHLRVIAPAGSTVLSEEMLQRWRPVGNCVQFELQTSRSKDERVTARPTGRLNQKLSLKLNPSMKR